MKVLYILHSTVNGGATISFKNLINGVVKMGITPIIIYPKGQHNEVIMDFEKMGIKCFPCRIALSITSNTKNLGIISSFVKLFILKVLSFFNLLRIATKTNPDIIHTNTGVIHEGYFVAKTLKKPHVWHIKPKISIGKFSLQKTRLRRNSPNHIAFLLRRTYKNISIKKSIIQKWYITLFLIPTK